MKNFRYFAALVGCGLACTGGALTTAGAGAWDRLRMYAHTIFIVWSPSPTPAYRDLTSSSVWARAGRESLIVLLSRTTGGAIWGTPGITRKLSDRGMAITGADEQTGANHAIVLFDGVCNLCDASVRFIIARDRHDQFRFAALQSAKGRSIAAEFGISGDLGTFFLIEGGRAFERSDAWLRILRHLDGLWSALSAFIIVPRPIRDWFYDFVGRNRYRWFGKKDYCPTPDPGLRHKFLA